MSSYRTIVSEQSCRIAVEGGLTAALLPDLQQALRAEVAKGARQVTFDLEKTSMIDSSGIGLLIATLNTLARNDGKIAVINTAPEILKLLRSVRLTARLNVSGSSGSGRDHE